MIVLGIDPGTTHSGVVVFDVDGNSVIHSSRGMENCFLLSVLREGAWFRDGYAGFFGDSIVIDFVFIETIEAMGQIIGNSTIKTAIWVGEFKEAWRRSLNEAVSVEGGSSCVRMVRRGDEKSVLCGGSTVLNPSTGRRVSVGDSNIRAAVIDRFPATGGGKTPQVGTKKKRGPLYGVKGHAWSALAVVLTGLEVMGIRPKVV